MHFGWARQAIVAASVVATFAAPSPPGVDAHAAVVRSPYRAAAHAQIPPPPPPTPDIAAVSALVRDAVAGRRLPGAVVIVGHDGKVAFRRAYGSRKLAGEPGLDGAPAPAEPMTENTIFDMASLTKVLATATSVMQLYERGRVRLDDPVQTYLPGFNAANDPRRARVTVRMLLTHTSGEPGDVNLDDPWGLARADRPEGLWRALTAPLESEPGQGFHYSDINFIVLGALIERLTGQSEDVYVQQNIFAPLGMGDSGFRPASSLLSRIAPTRHDGENARDPGRNPNFGHLLRGVVDDPTARRMGGVAGHAGLFSTARDVSIFAQALLDRLAGRVSAFPLSRASLELMTSPQQPGHTDRQAADAQRANRENGMRRYPAIPGQNLRGLGWDIDTGYSTPRGAVFGVGSFGHTGFTGTSLWIDPGSDTYVVVLSNAVHSPGSPPILKFAGEVATAAARDLGVDNAGPRRP